MRGTRIGSSTLMGVIQTDPPTYPQTRGNVFTVFTDEQINKERTIINIYVENLQYLISQGIVQFPIEIIPISVDRATVVDSRIPAEYYHS